MAIDVLDDRAITDQVLALVESRVPCALVTVLDASAVAGASPGQKLLVESGGRIHGAIGSSELTRAISMLSAPQIEAGTVEIMAADATGHRLSRGRTRTGELTPGTLLVSIEPLLPPDQLVIVGAGHIAVPLAGMAALLGYEVTVIDDRERFANVERFPTARKVIVDSFERAVASLTVTRWTSMVLVTRGHEHDEATLRQVIGSDSPYIGMIGSRRRVLVVFERLREMGVPEALLRRVYAPIGLDLGARTAEEIALAILAEMVNVKRGGRATSLRDLLPRSKTADLPAPEPANAMSVPSV